MINNSSRADSDGLLSGVQEKERPKATLMPSQNWDDAAWALSAAAGQSLPAHLSSLEHAPWQNLDSKFCPPNLKELISLGICSPRCLVHLLVTWFSWISAVFRFYLLPCYSSEPQTGACMLSQSCLTLCNREDCSPPGSSVHGILQARTLEWVPFLFQEIFPTQGLNWCLLCLFALAGRFFTTSATWQTGGCNILTFWLSLLVNRHQFCHYRSKSSFTVYYLKTNSFILDNYIYLNFLPLILYFFCVFNEHVLCTCMCTFLLI